MAGCSTVPEKEIVTRYETRTIYQDKYVEFDSWLVKDCEFLEPGPEFDLEELGAVHKQNRDRIKDCNWRWGKIREISGKLASGEDDDM